MEIPRLLFPNPYILAESHKKHADFCPPGCGNKGFWGLEVTRTCGPIIDSCLIPIGYNRFLAHGPLSPYGMQRHA